MVNQRHLILNLTVLNLFQGRNFFKKQFVFLFNILQDLCFQTFEHPLPLWSLQFGLNFAQVWLFGLVQCSFVSLGITRLYLIYKVSRIISLNLLWTWYYDYKDIFQFLHVGICQKKRKIYWNIVISAEKIWEGLNYITSSVSINNQHLLSI